MQMTQAEKPLYRSTGLHHGHDSIIISSHQPVSIGTCVANSTGKSIFTLPVLSAGATHYFWQCSCLT